MDVFDLYAKISLDPSEFESGLDAASKRFKDFSSNIKSISDGISKTYSGLGDLLSPAVEGFKAVESVGKTALSGIQTALKGFAAAATAVGGFGAAAVKSGMQFDATMSEVSAISGATGDEFNELRDKALEMGATTKFSASEAAQAMTYMGMAGWKSQDMISGIAGIMNLAAASGEDLAITSDIVTDALTAFGLSAAESGRFADVMAAAATNANTNVGMMGDTFKYVAPVAGAMGYSVEDSAIAIGLMANAGIKASSAGTALRSIITRLGTNAGATKTQMGALEILTEKLGVQFYNTDGTTRDLNSVLAESREAWRDLSEEQQVSYAKTIAGQYAMSGWLALMNSAPEDVDKLTAAIYECDGAAQQMADTMVDNLQGDLTLLGSAFESLQIAISDSLTPTLREFAQFGQRAMANLLEGFQSGDKFGFFNALEDIVAEGITMLSAKARDFVWVSTNFILSLSNGILDAKESLLSAGRTVIDFLINVFGEYLRIVSPEMAEFGSNIVSLIFEGFSQAGVIISDIIGNFVPLIAQAFLSYHETLFTIGIDILGAIGQGIVDNKDELQSTASETITNMVTALRDNAPAIIEGGIALLEALVGAIVDNLPLILSTGAEIVGELIKGISGSMSALILAVGAIVPYISKIIDVVGDIGKAVNDVIGVVKSVGTAVSGLFSILAANPIALVIAAVAALVAGFIVLWNNCEGFRNFWIGLWETLKSAVSAAVDAIVSFFTGLVESIGSALSGLAEFIGGVFSAAWELVQGAWAAAVEFFSGIWEGIQTVFSTVAEVLGSFFSAAWDAVQTVWGVVTEFFSGIADGIRSVFEAVTGAIGYFFSGAWDVVRGVWEVVSGWFSEIAEGIQSAFETATSFLSEAFSAAWEAVQGAWNAAVGFFGGIWTSISSTFSGVAEFFGGLFSQAWEAVTNAWDGVTEFFGGIWEQITGVFGNVWDKFKEIGSNIVSGLKDGILGAWDAFTSWLGDKVGGIVDGVKGLLGIHSPSTVFAGIGENMALGLAEGWDDRYSDIKRSIEGGLNFGTAIVGLSANWTGYRADNNALNSSQPGFGGLGNTTVNIYNPEKRDAVTEAREWKKTAQRIAQGYI